MPELSSRPCFLEWMGAKSAAKIPEGLTPHVAFCNMLMVNGLGEIEGIYV